MCFSRLICSLLSNNFLICLWFIGKIPIHPFIVYFIWLSQNSGGIVILQNLKAKNETKQKAKHNKTKTKTKGRSDVYQQIV